ncbi:MAG: glycosyltransferase, partial [Sinobacteraceae bacterium]|nr:glycosyltransferase [Nevskiaceae bacterium]
MARHSVRMVRIAQISFYTDPKARAPEALLSVWPTVVDCAECATLGGAEVAVIQSAAGTAHLEHNGVNYHFLPCGEPQRDPGQRAHLAALLTRLAPDVLHVQGLGFPAAVSTVAALLPRVPIVLQDHADRPPPLWRRAALRQATRRIAGVAFCARELARPFLQARLLGPYVRIYEIPESSSRFVPRDRLAARQRLGRSGRPLLLWVGRLDDNKDPLTVLEGIAAAVSALPGLELLCVYSGAPLLSAVQRRIAADVRLRHRVHLLGA